MLRLIVAILLTLTPVSLSAMQSAARDFTFASIDGGEISLAAFRGQPVLVTNTASMCGFTPQYDGLQSLHERYGPRGLVVLAVPSADFNQEYADAAQVKEFCEVNFSLTLPMTDITRVKGRDAHPFYQWVRSETGFVPRWNFNKVLLDGEGAVVATFGSTDRPTSPKVTSQIDALLAE
ncbi:MAG: glutathione peroxidase [Pseudomonadota bacterium]